MKKNNFGPALDDIGFGDNEPKYDESKVSDIRYGSLTEQGNFGLGFNEIDNEKDKEYIKKQIKRN